MDATGDIAQFLASRRARLTPDQVGLPAWGPRRVKGLRREEVAERAHLFDLARAANSVAAERRRPGRQRVRPAVLRIVDSISGPAMQITRSSLDTAKGPAGWFTGDVYIDTVAAPAGSSTFAAANVHFTPGARTAWHTHPHGQTIYVTEGVGVCQRDGGPVELIGPGDGVFFAPGENHWHGAAPNRFMVHLAMQQNDESGSPVTWGRHVTDDEYAAAPTAAG